MCTLLCVHVRLHAGYLVFVLTVVRWLITTVTAESGVHMRVNADMLKKAVSEGCAAESCFTAVNPQIRRQADERLPL